MHRINFHLNLNNKVSGITIESERFPNFAKEGQKEMTIVLLQQVAKHFLSVGSL